MRLDRYGESGIGKYGAINMRRVMKELDPLSFWDVKLALDVLKKHAVLLESAVGEKDEFFLIKLKDRYAEQALNAYANEALPHDPEYAGQVFELARRAYDHPLKKAPD
ncbi:hypothetical protein [Hyphomicrobium sp.]|uniref:hypothetical protein n=1 Tax=Hyphomicrobium sp. TaxID=82 RepID=UPI001DB3E95A|nr:hypothetical protein [Hyphomicrobium sp.]MBY0561420.1 hypothetical protein [Hyphomicrobium sp.]